ncbi:MAG TPA: hypothetical protein VG842_07180 [Sediminibacterium sp.]|nr:hypothetical protein [Sediminibacterium sp.]
MRYNINEETRLWFAFLEICTIEIWAIGRVNNSSGKNRPTAAKSADQQKQKKPRLITGAFILKK